MTDSGAATTGRAATHPAARRPWLIALAVAWAVVSLVVLMLAASGVLPWVSVSLVTVVSGVVAGTRWFLDRRALSVAGPDRIG